MLLFLLFGFSRRSGLAAYPARLVTVRRMDGRPALSSARAGRSPLPSRTARRRPSAKVLATRTIVLAAAGDPTRNERATSCASRYLDWCADHADEQQERRRGLPPSFVPARVRAALVDHGPPRVRPMTAAPPSGLEASFPDLDGAAVRTLAVTAAPRVTRELQAGQRCCARVPW